MGGQRAVIYLDKDSDVEAARAACMAHCERRGYQVIAVVMGTRRGEQWRDGVLAMLFSDDADVAVLHRRMDLPPNRRPRVEIAEEATGAQPPGRHRRRPRPRIFDR